MVVWREFTKESLEETRRKFASSDYVMQWYALASRSDYLDAWTRVVEEQLHNCCDETR